MLSSMLTAFVMPTSQKIVIATLTSGNGVQGRSSPPSTRRRSEDLADEFLVRLEVDQVVHEPDQKQERRRPRTVQACGECGSRAR